MKTKIISTAINGGNPIDFPLIIDNATLALELAKDEVYYKKSLSGDFMVKKDSNPAEYDTLINLLSLMDCQKIGFELYEKCNDSDELIFEGKLKMNNVGLNTCAIGFEVEADGILECMQDKWERLVNFYQLARHTFKVRSEDYNSIIEVKVCEEYMLSFNPLGELLAKNCLAGDNNWCLKENIVTPEPNTINSYVQTTWWREVAFSIGVPPPGGGWAVLSLIDNTWYRCPLLITLQDLTEVAKFKLAYSFNDVFEFVASETMALCKGYSKVVSNFLGINAINGECLPNNTAYAKSVKYKNMIMVQASDVKYIQIPDFTPATQDHFNISLKSILDMLRLMNLYYWFEKDVTNPAKHVLRVEHISYFYDKPCKCQKDVKNTYIGNDVLSLHSYQNYERVTFEWAAMPSGAFLELEGGRKCFNVGAILYNPQCNNGSLDLKTDVFMADVTWGSIRVYDENGDLQTNQDAPDSGFYIIATDEYTNLPDGTREYLVNTDYCDMCNCIQLNGAMSFSEIQLNLWRDNASSDFIYLSGVHWQMVDIYSKQLYAYNTSIALNILPQEEVSYFTDIYPAESLSFRHEAQTIKAELCCISEYEEQCFWLTNLPNANPILGFDTVGVVKKIERRLTNAAATIDLIYRNIL